MKPIASMKSSRARPGRVASELYFATTDAHASLRVTEPYVLQSAPANFADLLRHAGGCSDADLFCRSLLALASC
eukprot:CAMPEP_0183356616 /NCGR_PEP_ID=MMETSP0164_2-20130417/45090_1 /TAXON_ID=221442 /ORGANISM="Coccolithus pelagicus ssp braarudi, Strain PLY182g" /LENGTH=73 /DNA_ID=CAMNT_0025530081 /DNA_START=536 /DNA_END=757 /DNA_ORIENTATION=-